MKLTREERRRLGTGLLFIGPWLVGFLALTVYPLLSVIYHSLYDWSVLMPASFSGPTNYRDLFTDELFWKALSNTFFFAALSIPMGLFISLFLAILLNFEVPGRGIFRTVFFLTSLVPMICLAVLWQCLLSSKVGLVNDALRPVLDAVTGAQFVAPNWLQDARYAKLGLVFTGLWGGRPVGGHLPGGIAGCPAALVQGGGDRRREFLPEDDSHHAADNLLQYDHGFDRLAPGFAVPYVMTNGGGGPEQSMLFIATYLDQNAFDYWHMGYACAIGLILFLIVLALTFAAARLSERFIHYEAK